MIKINLNQVKCRVCNVLKRQDHFYDYHGNASGFRYDCIECHRISTQKWKQEKKSYRIQQAKLYRQRTKKQRAAYNKAWTAANRGLVAFYSRSYQLAKDQAMPQWLSNEQRQEMETIYKNRPFGQEVDHIVPIRGKDVCGLHVPWNLQYLPMSENRSKHNKLVSNG